LAFNLPVDEHFDGQSDVVTDHFSQFTSCGVGAKANNRFHGFIGL